MRNIVSNNRTGWLRKWGRAGGVAFLFATLAAGVFWLDIFRVYRSEISLLVIPKENAAGFGADQMVENIAELPRQLSFYERVLSDDDRIEDRFRGLTPDRRKAKWNDIVSVSRRDDSGMLSVGVRAETAEEAKRLTIQTVKTLLGVAAFYYAVEQEIHIRIVDGPITGAEIGNVFGFIGATLTTGAAVTGTFLGALFVLDRRLRQPSRRVSETPVHPTPVRPFAADASYWMPGASVPYIDPRKFLPEKPPTLSFETPAVTAGEAVKQSAASPFVKSAAPDNLPVMESQAMRSVPMEHTDTESVPTETVPAELSETFFREGKIFGAAEDVVPAFETEEQKTHTIDNVASREPTVEEYKRRLNELLEGRG